MMYVGKEKKNINKWQREKKFVFLILFFKFKHFHNYSSNHEEEEFLR